VVNGGGRTRRHPPQAKNKQLTASRLRCLSK
jgi:hypothetical protein